MKYFDSSESEEESVEDEEEAKSEQSEFKTSKAPVKGKKPQGRSAKDSSDAKESVDDESSDQESEEAAGSREWDEYCYICDDGGNVICCDGCSNVAHLSCLKMKQQPKDDWHCNECLIKIAQQRVTRGKSTELTKKQSSKQGRNHKKTRRY